MDVRPRAGLVRVELAVSIAIAIPIQGTVMLGAFALTRGLAHGGAIVDIPVLSKHCFGPKLLGRTIGLLTAFVTLGFAAGPPITGYLYDLEGSYRTAFLLLIAASVGAGITVLRVRPSYWEEHIRTAPAGGAPKPTETTV